MFCCMRIDAIVTLHAIFVLLCLRNIINYCLQNGKKAIINRKTISKF